MSNPLCSWPNFSRSVVNFF